MLKPPFFLPISESSATPPGLCLYFQESKRKKRVENLSQRPFQKKNLKHIFVETLHVGNFLNILHFVRIYREKILASGLLPFSKSTRFETGNSNFTQILSLVLVLLLVLELLPLLFRHAPDKIMMT